MSLLPVEPLPESLPPELRADVGPPSPLRRALGRLLHVVGIALLALVLWKVPWNDRALLADRTEIRGRILSEKPGEVLFQVPGEPGPRALRAADLRIREHGLPSVEEGVFALARRMDATRTLAVLGICLAMALAAAFRWRMLLRTQGVDLRTREAVSLTFLGNFLTQVVPGGLVGGDVLKALYAARGREKAAHAMVSVFVDRVLGLFGTVVLACLALLPRWDDPRFHTHAVMAYGVLVVGTLGGGAVLSRRIRAALRMEAWIPRLPFVGGFLAEADAAVLSFRERKGVILVGLAVSVGIHTAWCCANALLGDMLGIGHLGLTDYFAVIPPILIVAVIPLLPGGWGLGEASYVYFLGLVGVPAAPAVAVSVLGRVVHMVSSLPGGFVLLARRT